MAVYVEGPVFRSSELFAIPTPGSVEKSSSGMHFPGSASALPPPEQLSLDDLKRSGIIGQHLGLDFDFVRKRMKQIAAYAVMSGGSAAAPDLPSRVAVQHLCFDFSFNVAPAASGNHQNAGMNGATPAHNK